LECGDCQTEREAYKSATIAVVVIAVVSIAINIVLAIYLLRKTPAKGCSV